MLATGLALATLLAAAPQTKTLVDWNRTDPAAIRSRDAKLVASPAPGAPARAAFGTRDKWPSLIVSSPDPAWNLAAFSLVSVDCKNVGKVIVRIGLRVDGLGVDGKPNYLQATRDLAPGEQTTLRVTLTRCLPPQLQGKLFGMRGYPARLSEKGGLDPAQIKSVHVFAAQPKGPADVEFGPVTAAGAPPLPLPADLGQLFPMIDRFGQYRHCDWPGKTHAEVDLAQNRQREEADLARHPGPDTWDEFGGWKSGPKLEATGFFRAMKHQGRWWLVDPAGRLFWSHGIDCVRGTTGTTPISDRLNYFELLPPRSGPFAVFYGHGDWAPHGYYQGKRYETFCFSGANLLRKYGDLWQETFARLAHQRLRSWGLNTIANWSDPAVYRLDKTPYTATLSGLGKSIEGSTGYWGKFPDPFDPSLAETLRKTMFRDHAAVAADPWCLGFFVHNELAWGDELSLATAALASPATQAAKKAFLVDLKAKYSTIQRLNEAWGAQHRSWEALADERTPPDRKRAGDDLAAFATRLAEEYFRVCRDAVKAHAPHHLYLGCRFAWGNDRAVRAAAKYCDVVSFNKYQEHLDGFRLPEGVDKPAVIGEFHFGALDRGMFHTGLRPVADQAERANAYQRYVRSALAHPALVGTHWFQFADQATTGRGDGENYQIGFVDICDTPYPETIAASREVGNSLYQTRAATGSKP